MTKKNVKDLESMQRDAIHDILGLSKFANYNAVLAEFRILRAEDTVKLGKVPFISCIRRQCVSFYTKFLCQWLFFVIFPSSIILHFHERLCSKRSIIVVIFFIQLLTNFENISPTGLEFV